jgi:hypothetical protein
MTTESKLNSIRVRDMPAGKNIILLHLTGQYPLAGVAFQAWHYVAGLAQLGYDVHYIEDSGAAPYNPLARNVLDDCSYGVA